MGATPLVHAGIMRRLGRGTLCKSLRIYAWIILAEYIVFAAVTITHV
jgi:hypothetical protein